MFSSSNFCIDGCPAEHLPSSLPNCVSSNSDVSDVSEMLQSNNENMLLQNGFYSSGGGDLSWTWSTQQELNRARDGFTSGAFRTCGYHNWNLNGHQAKRARVENIIKGMSSCPAMPCKEVATNRHDGMIDNDGIEELPVHQEHMQRIRSGNLSHSQRRELLESQHQQLRKKFKHVDGVAKSTDSVQEGSYRTCNDSPDTSPKDAIRESCSEFESSSNGKYQGCKKVKLMNYFQTRPERIKLMADVLKYELSKAVSRSVDYIFKSVPLLQTSPNQEGSVEADASLPSPVCKDNTCRISCYGSAEVRVPDIQTEALSLVVQKPRLEMPDELTLQTSSGAGPHPEPPVSPSVDSAPCEHQPPEKNRSAPLQRALTRLRDGHSETGRGNFSTHWNSVKVRSKVNSRSVRSLQTHTMAVDPVLLENLYLSHVKIDPDSLMINNTYMVNEGLSTNHLKKAKLMFFYTRYPSSLVLKMCFQDVKFTRCITSQLIKWFSNFREFYYIQIEKFARHALVDGAADVRALTVGKESELFRALNVHYNKANDFQVPDRFLGVAEITLREFYVAISLGKDRDPSWKKAIYKVICKLDSDVPADFKTQHFV